MNDRNIADPSDLLADPHVAEVDPSGDELGGGLGNADGGEPATDG